ncbi:MAG TPA: DUF465 domain-containing protein [bacterium]|nr:DUF465 domain-containing protein [bacterium]
MSVHKDPEILRLAEHHPELDKLLTEHAELDKKVAALDKRHVRTPAEDLERRRLSKLKLVSRDQIALMVAKIKREQ